MSDQATFGISITANDRTAKGRRSAEKNLGAIPRHLSAVNRRQAAIDERAARSSTRGILRTLGAVEQASARAFGGRSVTAGITSRLGAIRAAGAAAGTGLGEAAASGGALSGALGAVGIAAGATIGVLAAATYGAIKLATNWAEGADNIGRLASILGIGTKAMQEFTAAGERAGVDKATGAGALGGLTKSLNDANYGRNNDVLALLSRMGVKLKKKTDGTVDVEAMLPDLADAIKGQNSSGRRTAAGILGVSEGALPMFTQGGKALTDDMAAAAKSAPMISDEDAKLGRQIQRRHTIGRQRIEKETADRFGRYAATGLDGAESWAINQFSGSVARDFVPASGKIDRAAGKMDRAAGQIASATNGGRGAIGLTREAIGAAQATERKYGIPASITLGQYGLESSWGRRMPAGSNNPFGIKAGRGQPFVTARTREEDRQGRSYYINARFRKFANLQEAFDEHAKLLAYGRPYRRARAALPSVGGFADALTGTYATDRQYGQKLKSIIGQKGLDQYDGGGRPREIPVKVEIEMRGAPPGTRVKVKAGRSPSPAISHAMPQSYTPARGG